MFWNYKIIKLEETSAKTSAKINDMWVKANIMSTIKEEI